MWAEVGEEEMNSAAVEEEEDEDEEDRSWEGFAAAADAIVLREVFPMADVILLAGLSATAVGRGCVVTTGDELDGCGVVLFLAAGEEICRWYASTTE